MGSLQGGELSPGLCNSKRAWIVSHGRYRGDAVGDGPAHRPREGGIILGGGRCGLHSLNQIPRVLLEQSGRLPGAAVPHDGAAGNIRGCAGDVGQAQGGRVGQTRMPVDPVEKHRILGRHGINPAPLG
jgi:hypothetical protein